MTLLWFHSLCISTHLNHLRDLLHVHNENESQKFLGGLLVLFGNLLASGSRAKGYV